MNGEREREREQVTRRERKKMGAQKAQEEAERKGKAQEEERTRGKEINQFLPKSIFRVEFSFSHTHYLSLTDFSFKKSKIFLPHQLTLPTLFILLLSINYYTKKREEGRSSAHGTFEDWEIWRGMCFRLEMTFLRKAFQA